MSEVLERRPAQEEVTESDLTLAELAERTNREHHAVEIALGGAIQHAIACGELLIAAQALVPRGGWASWLCENFEGGRTTAQTYIRFATYKDQLGDGAGLTLRDARHRLAFLAKAASPDDGGQGAIAPGIRAAAIAMHHEGASMKEAAEHFGVSRTAVWTWVNPEAELTYRRHRAAKLRAASQAHRERRRQERRDQAARRANGSIAESYSLIRRLTQQLDTAISEAGDGEARQALNGALRRVHQAEDEVVRALGVE